MRDHSIPVGGRAYRFLFPVLLLALGVLAFFNDWQYDEAASYSGVEGRGLWELVAYTGFRTANHQLFNSLHTRGLQALGMTHVFFYRLLSLAGFVLFFHANQRILERLGVGRWHILFVVLAPYYLFFPQARGYAVSLGCYSGALMSLLEYVRTRRRRHEYAMMAFGVLSVLSIFSFYFGFIPLFLYYAFLKWRDRPDVHLAANAVIGLALTLYINHAGRTIQTYDRWIIGTDALFKNGTVSSILSEFSLQRYFESYAGYRYIKLLVAGCMAVPFGYALWWGRIFRRDGWSGYAGGRSLLVLLIVASLALMFFAHVFLQAKYPLNRAVMYLQYLLLLYMVSATWWHAGRGFWVRIPLLLLTAGSCIQVFLLYANLFRPGMEQHIRTAGDRPLYILNVGYNPSVHVTNHLGSLRKTGIIQVSKDVAVMDSLVRADTTRPVYLLCHSAFVDSVTLDRRRVYDGRDGYVLYEIVR